MAVTSAQTKVMVIPEAKKVEVSETVINCPAPAATPADITKTTGGNSTVDIKESTARVARIVREDAAEEVSTVTDKHARAVTAMEEMRKRAERYREKPKELDDLAGQMEGLEIEDKAATFNEVFEQMPVGVGKAISKRERDETNQTGNSTLVYGEITFETLAFVLHKIKTRYGVPGVGHSGDNGVLQKPGGVFYDIGSGTGKPVIGAAILYPFRKSVGIEILEGLHAASMEVLKKWEAGRAKDEVGHKVPTNVRFIRGNALDFDTCNWSDADVVFANSTCFDDALMRNLATTASCLKKGSIFVTLTKRLPAADFKVLEHEMCPMSWGSATVYISQKTTEPFGDPNNPSGIADAGTE